MIRSRLARIFDSQVLDLESFCYFSLSFVVFDFEFEMEFLGREPTSLAEDIANAGTANVDTETPVNVDTETPTETIDEPTTEVDAIVTAAPIQTQTIIETVMQREEPPQRFAPGSPLIMGGFGNWKRSLCWYYMYSPEGCKKGNRCNFAHGLED